MHSMHPLPAGAEHEPAQVQQMQHEDQTATMTVLESLNPSQTQPSTQQVGLGEQSLQHQQHRAVNDLGDHLMGDTHLVQQHLVQSVGGQQPHLHQLQPSHGGATNASQALEAAVAQSQSAIDEQQQTVNQHHQRTNSNGAPHLLRQRPQIEGIVAEGGGPIVQWLLDNYEIADGESLPRSTVYNHYLAHCRQLQMASVNAASFGKLIRSVFVGLKTRRLGTRGHSKYHYFGVRAKQHIQQELLQHQDTSAGCSRENCNSLHQNNENSNQTGDMGSESDSTGNGLDSGRLSSGGSSSNKRLKRDQSAHQNGNQRRQQNIYQHRQTDQLKLNHDHHHQQQMELEQANGTYHVYQTQQEQHHNSTTNGFADSSPSKAQMINNGAAGNTDEHIITMGQHCELADFRNHLGANWATLVDEHWPQRDLNCSLERQLLKTTGGNTDLANLLELFEIKYKHYYKKMVELLSELKFLDVEQVWMEFWQAELQNQTSQQEPASTGQQWCATGEQGITNNQQNGVQQHHSVSDIVHQQQRLDYQQQNHIKQQPVDLTFHHLYQLTSQQVIIERINQIDYSLFAAIESFLLPDLLSPIPRPLAQHIRLFAKNIGPWIELAVKDYEPQFVAEKSKSARAFGYALRRYTSLNHLSTASRAIWEKRTSLAQMSMDLSRVDLRDIEHQVSLMSRGSGGNGNGHSALDPASRHLMEDDAPSSSSGQASNGASCLDESGPTSTNLPGEQGGQQVSGNGGDNNLPSHHHNLNHASGHMNNGNHNHTNHSQHQNNYIHHPHHLCAMQPAQLIQNFLHLLEDPYPANSWPDWCRNLVESRVCGLSLDEARNFVLKWNFYISLIMKELTLRSAPSFGSFQLIRLLFDEYIFYLVVTRLAQAQHKTPAQLLSM